MHLHTLNMWGLSDAGPTPMSMKVLIKDLRQPGTSRGNTAEGSSASRRRRLELRRLLRPFLRARRVCPWLMSISTQVLNSLGTPDAGLPRD